ncbi:alkaline phosphatase [Peptococcus simiae]|uniref:Alkaline phosphatase n=1 Tax=Peptococcus simiae TaxID=1643805 RepID=A0ABW9H106_9FIRM
MSTIKKLFATTLTASVLFCSVTFPGMPGPAEAAQDTYGRSHNVIMMIPDGTNVEAVTTTRWMTDSKALTMDSMLTGMVRTNNANTPIADSAPAGTAMSTGQKTESPFIATYPTKAGMPGAETMDESRAMAPLATVLEGAKRAGKSTGIISTSNIQHATPADFSSHHPNRNAYEDLGEQQVYQKMDVVLGAGSHYLTAENRADKEDLIKEIKDQGYTYVTTPAEMASAGNGPLWGMFAGKSMAYDIDRDPAKEPSLAEMTQKALDLLSQNDKGFFLMVEGSEVDWAAHANDPVGVVSDLLAFDKAVAVAKDFADRHGNTTIIIAADHGTGGMTFGERAISKGYDKAPLESFTKYIKNAKLTGQGVALRLNADRSNIDAVMNEAYGLNDLTNEERQLIRDAKDVQGAVGKVISDRSHIGWTTNGHVGGDVALYCYTSSPEAKLLTGLVFNHEIGLYMADLLDLDLVALSKDLYVPVRDAFADTGATITFDNSRPANPEVIVTKDKKTIIFPISKNYAIIDGKRVELDGLTVFNTQKTYVPASAAKLLG